MYSLRSLVQCTPMKRTLLAIRFAVLVSMMFMPCRQWGFWGWIWPQPFWIVTNTLTEREWRLLLPKLILQTVFCAVLFAMIVNIAGDGSQKATKSNLRRLPHAKIVVGIWGATQNVAGAGERTQLATI